MFLWHLLWFKWAFVLTSHLHLSLVGAAVGSPLLCRLCTERTGWWPLSDQFHWFAFSVRRAWDAYQTGLCLGFSKWIHFFFPCLWVWRLVTLAAGWSVVYHRFFWKTPHFDSCSMILRWLCLYNSSNSSIMFCFWCKCCSRRLFCPIYGNISNFFLFVFFSRK